MSTGGGYLTGVPLHPNHGSSYNMSAYINEKVEQNRKELHRKAREFSDDYEEIIHGKVGGGRNRKKLKDSSSSMLSYVSQMKAVQNSRLFIPAESTVNRETNIYNSHHRASLEIRQFPREHHPQQHLPRLAKSCDGTVNIPLPDRTLLCSPRSDISKSFSVPTEKSSRHKTVSKTKFRLAFNPTSTDPENVTHKSNEVNSKENKTIQKAWDSSDQSGGNNGRVNMLSGTYLRNNERPKSNTKTVRIKLPELNKDHDSGTEAKVVMEPNTDINTIVDNRVLDRVSYTNTFDETSEYMLDIASTSHVINDEDLKAERREEHTRKLLREAVDKLREIEEKYKNPIRRTVKLKKKKRLKLSNSLDSIPESVTESQEKIEPLVSGKKKRVPLARTPRTPVVVRPSLDVIPENSAAAATDSHHNLHDAKSLDTKSPPPHKVHLYHIEEEERTTRIKHTAFKGSKLNRNRVYSYGHSKQDEDYHSASGLQVNSQNLTKTTTAKNEDDFKSKRLQTRSKFGAKQKKLKFLKAF